MKSLRQITGNETFLILKNIGIILLGCIFTLYNLFLGYKNDSFFYYGMGIYYFILVLSKAIVFLSMRFLKDKEKEKKISLFLSFLILLFSISMIYPAYLLLTEGKKVNFDSILAIANAAYTTYKIVSSILSIKKAGKEGNSFFRKKLSLINMEGSIVTLILLENTMLQVFSKEKKDMTLLQNITTILLIASMILLSILSFIKTILEMKKKT